MCDWLVGGVHYCVNFVVAWWWRALLCECVMACWWRELLCECVLACWWSALLCEFCSGLVVERIIV